MTELEASLLSIAIEAPTALLLARLVLRRGWRTAILAALAASVGTLVTHPFAWEGAYALARHVSWPVMAAIVETAVALAEAVGYAIVARVRPAAALGLSVAANAASFGAGLLIWLLG